MQEVLIFQGPLMITKSLTPRPWTAWILFMRRDFSIVCGRLSRSSTHLSRKRNTVAVCFTNLTYWDIDIMSMMMTLPLTSTSVTPCGHPEVNGPPCDWSDVSMEDDSQTFFEKSRVFLSKKIKYVSVIQSIKCWPMNLKRSGIFGKLPALTNTLNISWGKTLEMKHHVSSKRKHICWHFIQTTI